MDLVSWLLGLAAGLIVAIVGKTVDYWGRARARELDIAALVGELRAGFAGLSGRISGIERRMSSLEDWLAAHTEHERRIVMRGD